VIGRHAARFLKSVMFAGLCGALSTEALSAQTSSTSTLSAQRDSLRRSKRPAPRRNVLTLELLQSAFADSTARELLRISRRAHLAQDSALGAYSARVKMQLSAWAGARTVEPERLALRAQQAARVQWSRASGVWIEPTGHRDLKVIGELTDLVSVSPIPYWPDRETLWIPTSSDVDAEINTRDVFHPLGTDAEADYRYATGDSISMRLPDGRTIRVFELRVTARVQTWHSVVGSFWIDRDSGNLVRAAYRLAADLDLWQFALEPHADSVAAWKVRSATDSGAAVQHGQKPPGFSFFQKIGVAVMAGSLKPFRVSLPAISVEYGLYEGRFWLPEQHSAQAQITAGALRVRIRWNESFAYDSVNRNTVLARVPLPRDDGVDTTEWVARAPYIPGNRLTQIPDTTLAMRQSLIVAYTQQSDSLGGLVAKARDRNDTTELRRRTAEQMRVEAYTRQLTRKSAACETDSMYFAGTTSRYGGALRIGVRMPCDHSRLDRSADLPSSIYDSEDKIFGSADRDALLKSLSLSLQPSWDPQTPTLLTGLSFLRYNRIEGLSLGGSAKSVLGRGYVAQLDARIGIADATPNGELSIVRSNGRTDWRAAAFHRLAVANDDWGQPLSLAASVSNLLFARDEGFYYRAWGAELSRTASLGRGTHHWRLFAERQWSAGTKANTQASLASAWGSAKFTPNVDASQLSTYGVSTDWRRVFGDDPRTVRVMTRARFEGGYTTAHDSSAASGYGRFLGDVSASRTFGMLAGSATVAGGTSAGTLPLQRGFYIGGLQSVRGQFARPAGDGRIGDSFWLSRTELGIGSSEQLRPALFFDAGWAGNRSGWSRGVKPLTGTGAGISFLNGVVRFDAARGLWPEKRWRFDFTLGARF